MSVTVKRGAAALAASGVLFFCYPALRPYSDESSLTGAEAVASNQWLLSHALAMVAFVLLAIGLRGFYAALQVKGVSGQTLASVSSGLCTLSVAAILTFYGAETYALNAIAQEALVQNDPELLAMFADVRSGFGLWVFALGLLVLALSTIATAVVAWKTPGFSAGFGVVFALAFVLYLPQFMGTPMMRIGHGALVMVGCIGLAVTMWRQVGRSEDLSVHSTATG